MVEQALERGLADLRFPHDGENLLVKELSNSPRFAVQCLECQRWALTLAVPEKRG